MCPGWRRLWNGEGGGSYLTTGGGGYLHQFGGALSLLNNLGCLPAVGVEKLLKHGVLYRPAGSAILPPPSVCV